MTWMYSQMFIKY
nr:unnamed protein product [Callosobruchus analis]